MPEKKLKNDPAFLDFIDTQVQEAQRLSSLIPIALVHECLQYSFADEPRVIELMNRVCPGWTSLDKDGNPLPEDKL